jgi:uncharacterized protein YdhG (YjbR/CyaY superfamily)
MTATRPAQTVDDYLASLPDEAREVLQGIREAIRDAAPSAEETMSYGIPLYKLKGRHLIGFGAAKRHLSLYVTDSGVLERFKQELANVDYAGTKTTIRFTIEKPVSKSLVTRIVKSRIGELESRRADRS